MGSKLFILVSAPVMLPLFLVHSIACRLIEAAHWVYLDMAKEIESMRHIWRHGVNRKGD